MRKKHTPRATKFRPRRRLTEKPRLFLGHAQKQEGQSCVPAVRGERFCPLWYHGTCLPWYCGNPTSLYSLRYLYTTLVVPYTRPHMLRVWAPSGDPRRYAIMFKEARPSVSQTCRELGPGLRLERRGASTVTSYYCDAMVLGGWTQTTVHRVERCGRAPRYARAGRCASTILRRPDTNDEHHTDHGPQTHTFSLIDSTKVS